MRNYIFVRQTRAGRHDAAAYLLARSAVRTLLYDYLRYLPNKQISRGPRLDGRTTTPRPSIMVCRRRGSRVRVLLLCAVAMFPRYGQKSECWISRVVDVPLKKKSIPFLIPLISKKNSFLQKINPFFSCLSFWNHFRFYVHINVHMPIKYITVHFILILCTRSYNQNCN